MEDTNWLAILLSGLLSALLASLVTTFINVRQERRKAKLALLVEIMGNRHGLTPGGGAEANARFLQALNCVFAVFHDSREVVFALQDFKKFPQRAGDNVTQLIRRMSHDLKIDASFLEDSFFDEPFIPRTLG
jgi:hypothetical protein